MMVKAPGRLVVFEGVDAVGKTSLCNDLCQSLEEMHLPHQRVHFPGKDSGTLGELIYQIHHRQFDMPSVDPCTLQLLHIAAHVDIIETTIKQSVAKGDWVVLDRFWWSTYVYGLDSGVGQESLELMIEIEKNAWEDLVPDVLLLVDAESPLRDDEANCAAWHRKRELYHQVLDREQDQYCCVVIQTTEGEEARRHASGIILREVLR